ncbi:uncharacterized protein EKO05_0000400 [Ascochyta rabiei]|uniref:uncharacterized protein n=1 Tax=Didymella rabiei TaxID=5454 RepID=UPI0022073780|nr:uncharacterized protein EKO05_0000400 [Ascochyta rabiei]UPX09716.1 hypothetical protein EKO05_0000400 [Ascochyta rabiei]
MPTLTRIPLAAVVCPSAPFLAPRLLRATVPLAVPLAAAVAAPLAVAALQSSQQQRGFASTPRCHANAAKGKKSGRSYFLEMRKREQQQARRRERGDKDPAELSPEVVQLALQLQQACEARHVQQLVDLYPVALAAGIVDSSCTRIICQALHAAVRRSAAKKDSSKPSELLPFVELLIADLRRGALPPHPYAYVHLLGIYKHTKRFHDGRALWLWLAEQDDAHVSQAAYGAAIELMAYGGLMSLPELELLYQEGLKRFPGTYAEYHLSPDAIIPDRTQPVHILGLPTTLLQGIITARLMSRDWRKAYLGLDTVLRLYPGQTPHRIFELFITERPLSEAYTAYLLACRSGVQISGGQVTNLLNRLRVLMPQAHAQADRFTILRAMANALYAYQQCGAGLSSVHVGQFIKAFEFVLPDKAPGQDYTDEEAGLRDTIALAAHQSLAGLIQSGLSPDFHPFVSLVSLAGKLRAPDLLKLTLADAKTAGIAFGPIERRVLLTAAGLIKDRNLIQALWSLTVTSAEKEGVLISYNDWVTLAKACRRADLLPYFDQQLQEQAHAVTTHIEECVRLAATNPEPDEAKSSIELMTLEQLNTEIKALQAQMENMRAVLMSGQPLNPQNSPFYMHIDPKQPSLGTEEALRAVYDEFTTDPHQPPAPAPADGSPAKSTTTALSKTGIPLDELRFRNWVNVHEMMSAASAYETSRQSIVDKAIAQRKSPKDIPEILHLRTDIKPAQSQVDLANRIKELRTPDQVFRRIGSEINDEKFNPMVHDPEANTWRKPTMEKHSARDVSVRKHASIATNPFPDPKPADPPASRWYKQKSPKA